MQEDRWTKDQSLRDYKNLIKGIKYVDNLQTMERLITITILMAVFLAIAFVLSYSGDFFHISRIGWINVICMAGVLFITLMGILDLFFHERLLLGNVAAALKTEEENEWIPPMHYNMIRPNGCYESSGRKSVFYIGCVSIILTLMGVNAVYAFNITGPLMIFFVILATAFGIFLYTMGLMKLVGNSGSLINSIVSLKKKKYVYWPSQPVDDKYDIEIHSENREYQHHYSLIKFQYKKMALVWTVGMVAIFGFFISRGELSFPVNNFAGIAVICMMALGTINCLWFLDVNVYHRLLNASFLANIFLEERGRKISKSHHYMLSLLLNTKFDPVMIDGIQYFGMSLLLVVLGGVAVFFQYGTEKFSSGILMGLSFIALFSLIEIFMFHFSVQQARYSNYKTLAQNYSTQRPATDQETTQKVHDAAKASL